MAESSPDDTEEPRVKKSWLMRFGALGFAFFFIKGLLWLAIPAVLALIAWLR